MANFFIEKMTEEDIDDVMKIDKMSFPTPWTRDLYEAELIKNKHAHYFVVAKEEQIIGFIGLWIVADDAQVTNIAIDPQYRGHKIGEKLFGYGLTYAINQGAMRISLEVRVSNKIAQNMYRKFGLVPGGIRKNYYPDNGEDAIVMWANLA